VISKVQALRAHARPFGVAVKPDAEIRDDVIRELQWDPQLTDPDAIGVAIKDGAVTLTGHAPSYAEKVAAASATARIFGVKAVADDVEVHLPGEPRDDADIARSIAHVLESNTQIPEGGVRARVQNAWVRLEGQVSHDYQRREVKRMVRHIRGVLGITDAVAVTPPASPGVVEAEIEAAFKRGAEVDARHIRVEVSDHTVTLYGHVHSLREAAAAAAAAAAAPGVARVDSRIVVSP